VVSGDGTINEVLRGLNHPSPPIAVFPAGTGNDVARMLGIRNETHAYETAVSGVVRHVDFGMASSEPFLNIFSFGFDAAIATQANEWKNKFPGWFLYPAALIKTIFSYTPPEVRISINGEILGKETPKQKILLLAVCNGGYYGGGMNINPLADPFDGKLELCIIKPMPRLKILLLFPVIYSGRHLMFKEVSIVRVSQVAFSSESTLLLNNDGETRPGKESDITLSTQGVQMMCPKNMV
jgi:diacylglycerol kinase (ATP)